MQRPGNLKHWWQQWTILTCLDSQRLLASKIQFLGMTPNQCTIEDDDDEYCDDELDETACTVGTPTDDPQLLEQFYGNASAS